MKHYEYEISLFVENELPLDKKEKLFLHLSMCKRCTRVLIDYKKIKNDVAFFYKSLPAGNFETYRSLSKKNYFWQKNSSKLLIPISAAVLIMVIILFLIKPGLHQQQIGSATAIEKGSSEKTINNEENNLILSTKDESKIIKDDRKRVFINHTEIDAFNKIIDRSLNAREQIQTELLNTGYNYKLEEFNKFINISFYNTLLL